MADKSNSSAHSDAEIKSAIIAFEQILDAEPNDRLALETLSEAYERMGDEVKAVSLLVRLAEVVANENDVKTAPGVIARLKNLSGTAESLQAQKTLQDLVSHHNLALGEAPEEAVPVRRNHDITREVSLAWDLLQAEEIGQDIYAGIVHDLSENSSKHLDVPVTVLHALQDRNYPQLDRVLAFLARASGKPLIALTHFETIPEINKLLPPDFMSRRGAIAYEKLGRDLLIAVLNPFDTELQEDCRKATDRRCHFNLTSAAEYDATLAAIRKLQSDF